ncbi:hypothetical protein IVB41_24580 [Bradyrhizobium sp. 44]|uniref:hypothetical protein n=1 Tax=Bradyrhizobium sp. 44 TaxID=2782675 RepID=UPI001FF949FB|nr:hypothetical protein [Bradyrhizobium sp. 44]MCK1287089.1 hypothetical protein [Bradyrhizobium sp. 44]
MTRFYAFAVDIYGTVEAHYTLAAENAEAAKREAERHLQQREAIEVWSEDRRRIARLVRSEG